MFHDLWERLGGSRSEAGHDAAPPTEGLADTHKRLEDALEQLNQRVVSYKKARDIAESREYTAAEVADREAVAVKVHEDAMMAAILKEHERLRTGLTAERIAVVCERMQSVAVRSTAAARTLPERLDEGVRVLALQKTGELAWEALESAMARHGVEWPEPGGMGHHPSPERIAQVRKMEAARMRAAFLGTRANETADMAHGLVRIWKTVYPEPGTNLYAATALQGVGAGLWCFYAAVAQALALQSRAALEQKADDILSEGLSKLSDLLASSPEIDPAIQTSVQFRSQEIIAEVIPDMVWAEIGERVRGMVPGDDADRLLAATLEVAVSA